MRLRFAVLMALFYFLFPVLAKADQVLYTLSVDYSGIGVNGPGSTLQWQFEVPSILTTPTTITTFLSASLGPGLSGCSISDVQIPLASPFSGYSSFALTDFASACGLGDDFTGAGTLFVQSLSSDGVYDAYAHNGNVLIGTLTISDVPAVPEASALSLLSSGLLGLVGLVMLKSRHSRSRSVAGSTALPTRA
jgi:hypothetical protein